jgi:hypothetical protein
MSEAVPSKVTISALDRAVTIEHPGASFEQLGEMIKQARDVWEGTGTPPRGTQGPAYGFTIERRPAAGYEPVGNGNYGRPAGPVTAGGADG